MPEGRFEGEQVSEDRLKEFALNLKRESEIQATLKETYERALGSTLHEGRATVTNGDWTVVMERHEVVNPMAPVIVDVIAKKGDTEVELTLTDDDSFSVGGELDISESEKFAKLDVVAEAMATKL